MANMIDMGVILGGAKAGSDFLSMPEFTRGMGASRRPVTASGVPYEEPVTEPGYPGRVAAYNTQHGDLDLGAMRNTDTMGGAGGDSRSYVPEQDQFRAAMVPGTTYGQGTPDGEPAAQGPEQVEQQKAQVEQVANGNATIDRLLTALQAMASMQTGGQGNPVFQLDAVYKNSSALQGIPGTVAQYPTAGGATRETDYSF